MPSNERHCLIQFNDLGLAEPLLRAIAAEGYTSPTPIQAKVIPAMLGGQDIVGIAQTGTGKTASFVLPLLHHLLNDEDGTAGAKRAGKTCGALILAPTRELAAQIADNIQTYGRFMRLSVTVVVGGVKPGKQIRTLAGGVDIVVATPGRLLDHVQTGAIRLDATRAIILDEGDQMLDLGFMPAIRRIMAKLPKSRQTVLMSATMPKQIRSLANDFLKNPVEISVAAVSRPIERIVQSVLLLETGSKRRVLKDILSKPEMERAIVFTRTKRGADKVCQHLNACGLNASAIHGNKSQGQRERTLASFRSGDTPILVATDIAARGIDIDDVSHVINYELPNVPEAYVHRIGRTARAGRNGIAVSFCDPTERALLRDIEKLIGNRLESEVVKAEPLDNAPSPKVAGQGAGSRQASKPARSGRGRGGATGETPGAKHKVRSRSPGAKSGRSQQQQKSGADGARAGAARAHGKTGPAKRTPVSA